MVEALGITALFVAPTSILLLVWAVSNHYDVKRMEKRMGGPQRTDFLHRAYHSAAMDPAVSKVPEPSWSQPSDAEREYARATMPGKATGHIIGYRNWRIRKTQDEDALNDLLDKNLYALPPHQLWERLMALYQSVTSVGHTELYRLESITSDHVWEPGEPVIATLDEKIHRIGKGAGVYAYRNANQVGASVFGEIALWGDVVEHENGYRARYAYPVRLTVYNQYANAAFVAQCLAETYGCPCDVEQMPTCGEALDHQRALASMHPNAWADMQKAAGRQNMWFGTSTFLQSQMDALYGQATRQQGYDDDAS